MLGCPDALSYLVFFFLRLLDQFLVEMRAFITRCPPVRPPVQLHGQRLTAVIRRFVGQAGETDTGPEAQGKKWQWKKLIKRATKWPRKEKNWLAFCRTKRGHKKRPRAVSARRSQSGQIIRWAIVRSLCLSMISGFFFRTIFFGPLWDFYTLIVPGKLCINERWLVGAERRHHSSH